MSSYEVYRGILRRDEGNRGYIGIVPPPSSDATQNIMSLLYVLSGQIVTAGRRPSGTEFTFEPADDEMVEAAAEGTRRILSEIGHIAIPDVDLYEIKSDGHLLDVERATTVETPLE